MIAGMGRGGLGREVGRPALTDAVPARVDARLGDLALAVPPLSDLMAADADVAELAGRWRAYGR